MAWSVGARGARFILGLATSAIVVRGLGSHDYGVLSVIRSVLMFVIVLAGVGTGQALLKFLPTLRVARSGSEARRLVRRVALAHAFGWIVLLAAAFAARGWTERVFHAGGIGTLIAAAVGLACFEILFTFASQVLNASYDVRRMSIAAVASHVVYLVALLAVFRAGWGVLGVLSAAALGNAVACVVVAARVRAATEFGSAEDAERVASGRVLRYAIPLALAAVLNLVVWRQSETLLLGHFRSPEETGYFDLAYRLPQTALEFVPGTVWPLVMAGMSEAFARDRTSLRRVIARYYRMLFVLCAPICVVGALLSVRVVETLFGSAMTPAGVPMRLFFLILTVSFFSTPLSMALYVLEKTQLNLLIYCALAVINVGLDLLLIPKYGVPGAIAPVAIAIALQPVMYYIAVRRLVPDVAVPFGYVARCFAACAPALVVLPVLDRVSGATGLIAAALLATVVIAAAYRWSRLLGGEELEAIASMPAPLGPGIARLLGGTNRAREHAP